MENRLIYDGPNSIMSDFIKTDDILKDMCGIIESSQKAAYQAVNIATVRRNWLLGYRIASEEMRGKERARYGAEIIKKLAKELSQSMEKDLQNLIYTVFMRSIKLILRFSRQRLENLRNYYRGRIMQCCCK